jgi:hypothetical protein
MFWLKCCPRCCGDLYHNRDQYGYYIACLHCGHYLSEAEEVILKYAAQPSPAADLRENLVRAEVSVTRVA